MRAAHLPFTDTPPADTTPDAPPDLTPFDTIDLDCETTGLDRFDDRPVGLAVGAGGRTWYLPFAHRGGGNLDEAIVRRWATRELRGKRIRNLNTKFDLHILANWGVDLRAHGCTFHDVAHAEALLDDHETTFTLDALAEKRLGQRKGTLPAHPSAVADLPAWAVAAYARQDVALVAALAEAYAPLLRADGLEAVAALEDRVLPAAVEMERNGLPLDLPRLDEWERRTGALLESLQWELYRSVGFTVNVDAATDLQRLFRAVGATWGFTETGAPSFSAEVMQEQATRHPAVALAWRIGKLVDLRSKSIVKYLKDQRGGKLYPSFHQLKFDRSGGTVSGRFSSSGPNGQNIMAADKYDQLYGWLTAIMGEPLYIRRAFVAPAGQQWVCADKMQVELRAAAHYANAARLLEAYAADPYTDFHSVTHALLKKVRPETTRTECKTTSFTRLYGGQAGTIGRRLGLSAADTASLLTAYDQAFPEWGALLRRASQVAETRGYVRTLLGRRARFPRGPFYPAANRVIQGTCADDMKLALADVYEQRHALGVTLLATVHDELDQLMPLDADVPALQAFLDRPRLDVRVPLLWSIKTGASWHDAK